MSSTTKAVLFLAIYAMVPQFCGGTAYCIDDIQGIIDFVKRESGYDWGSIVFDVIDEEVGLRMARPDELLPHVELLGALRHFDAIGPLAENLFQPSIGMIPPRAYYRYPCILALVRHDSAALDAILKQCKNGYDPFIAEGYFSRFFPTASFLAIIDEYVNKNETNLDANQKQRLLELKKHFSGYLVGHYASCPLPLSDFVLTHPLYKARQSSIAENLAALREPDKALSAVQKLGELRAVEAVASLVPMLVTPEYRLNGEYPVAVALAQIGIPSIWGLLDEIAAKDHDDEYLTVAYKTMTEILPAVAIPGFVNETVKKLRPPAATYRAIIQVTEYEMKEMREKESVKHQADELAYELAYRRLGNLYPLMGLEPLPAPERRDWQPPPGVRVVSPAVVEHVLQPNEVLNSDGSINTETTTTIRKSGNELVASYPPIEFSDKKPISRWHIFATINGIGILLLLLIWALWRRGN
jgi:hypothetical protein